MSRSAVMTVLLALVGVFGVPLTWAQAESAPTEQTATYSDAELKSFAAAALEVHRINSAYLPQMAEAEPADQRKLEQQALRETTAAVEKQGLTSDRYDEILSAAQTRTEVAKKVEQFLNTRTPRPGTTEL
jgi:hypothetical protein